MVLFVLCYPQTYVVGTYVCGLCSFYAKLLILFISYYLMIEKKVHKSRAYKIKQAFVITFSSILLLAAYFFENAPFILRVVSAIEFLLIFYLIDHFFEVRFRAKHYMFMLIIATSGLLLSPLFFIWPNYDKIQHFIQPMLICSILLFMISKLKIKYRWQITFAFFITVAILGIFEIGEFTLDNLFDMKLQGVYLRDMQGLEKFNLFMDPLNDTMVDLIIGTIGSGLFVLTRAIFSRKK